MLCGKRERRTLGIKGLGELEGLELAWLKV